ncbi:MAG: hypothetical protein QOE97_1355 [Pseudonocardiales bacterium]|nr:hypothetical protein [Pseudonocardiales bacterium]
MPRYADDRGEFVSLSELLDGPNGGSPAGEDGFLDGAAGQELVAASADVGRDRRQTWTGLPAWLIPWSRAT